MKHIAHEILLAFWKVHILRHAAKGTVHGQAILTELRRHGFDLSPGTLYPLLHRMERLGWLESTADAAGGKRARRDYHITTRGREVLEVVRGHIRDLSDEVASDHDEPAPVVTTQREP